MANEKLQYLTNIARYPKENLNGVVYPYKQVSSEEWNKLIEMVSGLGKVNGQSLLDGDVTIEVNSSGGSGDSGSGGSGTTDTPSAGTTYNLDLYKIEALTNEGYYVDKDTLEETATTAADAANCVIAYYNIRSFVGGTVTVTGKSRGPSSLFMSIYNSADTLIKQGKVGNNSVVTGTMAIPSGAATLKVSYDSTEDLTGTITASAGGTSGGSAETVESVDAVLKNVMPKPAFELKNKKVAMAGASISYYLNGYFQYAMHKLGISGTSLCDNGANIAHLAHQLYSDGANLSANDILIISHIHNYDVFTLPTTLERYLTANYETNATFSKYIVGDATANVNARYGSLKDDGDYTADEMYAGLFDYCIKKWYDLCATKNVRAQIGVETYWHDGRDTYNIAIRKLALKWELLLIDYDTNIGFSKDRTNFNTGTQYSLDYAEKNNSLVPGSETIDGVAYGWHPARMTQEEYTANVTNGAYSWDALPEIQKRRCDILVRAIRESVVDLAADSEEVWNAIEGKQATLVSGTNIKTINGASILGSGDMEVFTAVDAALYENSENPVQNKVICQKIKSIEDDIDKLTELNDNFLGIFEDEQQAELEMYINGYTAGWFLLGDNLNSLTLWRCTYANGVATSEQIGTTTYDFTDFTSSITELKAAIADISLKTTSSQYDLEFADKNGGVLARFANGHLKTKNFDSSRLVDVEANETSGADLELTDKNGGVLVRFANGHIKTKNFDSSNVSSTGGNVDLSSYQEKLVSGVNIATINGRSLLSGGNITISGGSSSSQTTTTIVTNEVNTLKVLCMGNSYTKDALSCVRSLVNELGCGCNIMVGYLWGSNKSLDNVLGWFTDGTTIQLNYISYGQTSILKTSSMTVQQAIQYQDWDWIAFQQVSSKSHQYSTYSAISQLITKSKAAANNTPKFAYLHAQDNASTDHGVTRFNGQASACRSLLQDTGIESIIPCGTALQNIRTLSSLNNYGETLDQEYDNNDVGGHLQSGIGQYVEGLAFMQWMLRQMNISQSVLTSQVVPTALSYYDNDRGTVVGITANNAKICRMAAVAAVRNPNEITNMSAYTTVTNITPN